LELVHLDLCGIIHLASKLSIMIPLMVFIKLFNFIHRRFQPFHMAIFLKEKSQGLYAKVEFLFTPLKLLALCNNQGGEYISREFFCFSH
jgi:hypothetical protein